MTPTAQDNSPGRNVIISLIKHPLLKTVSLIVLLLSSALLVGVYMHVVNRYVTHSVRVFSSANIDQGESIPLRATVFRPDSRQVIEGTLDAQLRSADYDWSGEPIVLSLVTGEVSQANMLLPPATDSDYQLDLTLAVSDYPPLSVEIPLTDAPSQHISSQRFPSGAVETSVDVLPGSHVQLLRRSPREVPLRLSMVANGNAIPRFIENSFYLLLTDLTGNPIPDQSLNLQFPSTEEPLSVTTDMLGLAQFETTLSDPELWSISGVIEGGSSFTFEYEVVPSFEGLSLAPYNPVIDSGTTLLTEVETQLMTPFLYLDLLVEGQWMRSDRIERGLSPVSLSPPGAQWIAESENGISLGLLQLYSSPFSRSPQSTVRCLLIHEPLISATDAMKRLVHRIRDRETGWRYLDSLSSSTLFDDNRSDEELERLLNYICSEIEPVFHPLPVVYDSSLSQIETLEAETVQFRKRAHWLMGMGAVALLLWITGRVLGHMLVTQRRTHETLYEMDEFDPTLSGVFGVNAGYQSFIWLGLAVITIGGFCLGVILLLAAM